LLVVLAVLVALAGLVVPLLSPSNVGADSDGDGQTETAQAVTTETSLTRLRDVLAGTPQRPGLRQDLAGVSADRWLQMRMADLFRSRTDPPDWSGVLPEFDPQTGLGWRGPYLLQSSGLYEVNVPAGFTADYGADGDRAIYDGWGRPIVVQWPSTSDPDKDRVRRGRLVSAGENRVLETDPSVLDPDPTDPADVGDDLVVYFAKGMP